MRPVVVDRGGAGAKDDRGAVALILALSVTVLLSLTVGLVVQLASDGQTNATVNRVQSQALYAADAGLNVAYQTIGTATYPNLPCGISPTQLATTPGVSTYSASIAYFSSQTPSTSSAINCPLGMASAVPLSAEVGVTGVNGGAHIYMKALVLTSFASFNEALFSNSNITFTQSANLNATPGQTNNAPTYANGSFACNGSGTFQGDVTIQGSYNNTSQSCSVGGNLWAAGSVSLSNSTTVGGWVKAAGANPLASTLSMIQSSTVGGNAYAAGTILNLGSGSIGGRAGTCPASTCFQNQGSGLATPPVLSMPTVPNVTVPSSAWSAAGYANQISDNNCGTNNSSGSNSGGVYDDIVNQSTGGTLALIVTNCTIYLPLKSSNLIQLSHNVAIISTGGFVMNQSTEWSSTSSTVQSLYLMVPSSVTCSSGSPGISLNNSTKFDNTVQVLMFTPCTISLNSSGSVFGQIYGGTITQAHSFNDTFEQLAPPPGSNGGGSSGLSIAYEHQTAAAAAFP